MILQSMPCSILAKVSSPRRRLRPSTSRRRRTTYYSKIYATMPHNEDDHDQEEDRSLQKGLVDSNIAMLYSRISQLKSKDIIEMIEPIEKGHCATLFESSNLEVLGLVQFEDLLERPRVAIGVSVMASFCLPISVIVIMLYLMDMAKVVVDRVQDASSSSTDNLNQYN